MAVSLNYYIEFINTTKDCFLNPSSGLDGAVEELNKPLPDLQPFGTGANVQTLTWHASSAAKSTSGYIIWEWKAADVGTGRKFGVSLEQPINSQPVRAGGQPAVQSCIGSTWTARPEVLFNLNGTESQFNWQAIVLDKKWILDIRSKRFASGNNHYVGLNITIRNP